MRRISRPCVTYVTDEPGRRAYLEGSTYGSTYTAYITKQEGTMASLTNAQRFLLVCLLCLGLAAGLGLVLEAFLE